MTTRRGFLGAMLAAATAPAFVKAGALMPIYVPQAPKVLTLWGDGIHDDTAALQAAIMGGSVVYADGRPIERGFVRGGTYRTSATLVYDGRVVGGIDSASVHSSASPVVLVKPDGRGSLTNCFVHGNNRPDSIGLQVWRS